jgi:hypothetical protein
VNDSGDIGEAVRVARHQSLISALFCGMPNEFGNRFALDGGGPLDFFI